MGAKRLALCTALLLTSAGCFAQDYIRDPFIKLSEAPNKPVASPLSRSAEILDTGQLQLRAILWSDQPLANISGMIVAPGDRVHEYTVQQLTRKSATLRKADDSILLVLDEDS